MLILINVLILLNLCIITLCSVRPLNLVSFETLNENKSLNDQNQNLI
jgi:hypothetical protein